MDMSRYRDLFVAEAREHLAVMGETILALEKAPASPELIDSLFRCAHSLKGMASSMEYPEIATLAHSAEGVLSRVRAGALSFDAGAADLLLTAAGLLGRMVDAVAAGEKGAVDASPLIEQLLAFGTEPETVGEGKTSGGRAASSPSPVDDAPLPAKR
ncbi:Hpt domain-containing protein [Geobacter pickeringii]|uniref:HPt domain-containing protein n=1 Tax=Geobacter pickeringii TaxID=345632 RepID=A0A0B5BDA0_9BACT|nr:Hpt domain-containing protein [Geobacter pickeringii]AJE04442.1 hypothetical protein GPICK_14725 [Geobacter pickeringii]